MGTARIHKTRWALSSTTLMYDRGATMLDVELNRGSDLKLSGVWRDQDGAALNLVGWSIAVFEPHPAAVALTVSWTDASVGAYRADLPWNDGIPSGRIMSFRLRISKDGENVSSPATYVRVK